MFYDLEKREEKTVLEDAEGFQLAAGREKLLAWHKGTYSMIELKEKQKLEKKIDTAGFEATIDPVAEWRQIFNDAWRLQRDYFYDPGLHGVNWNEMRERYDLAETAKGVVIVEHTFPDGSIAYTLYGHMEQTDTLFFPPVGQCVDRGRGRLDHPQGLDHASPEAERRDGEVVHGALGAGAVVGVVGNLDLAHRVLLAAHRLDSGRRTPCIPDVLGVSARRRVPPEEA